MSFGSLLVNTVVVEKRTVTTNDTNEEIETFTDGPTISASVQDKTHAILNMPDFDGPVLIDAEIFTRYDDGVDIDGLDVLRQTDGPNPRRYQVIKADDPAGRHHHFQVWCRRIQVLEAVVGS